MLAAQVRKPGSARVVGVLEQIHGFLHAPGARFTASMVSTSASWAQRENSPSPTALDSMLFHAGSSRLGRSDTGPTPSSQRYPETKLPPG